jgi:hypothetical protein
MLDQVNVTFTQLDYLKLSVFDEQLSLKNTMALPKSAMLYL